MTNTHTHRLRSALGATISRPVFWVCPKRFTNSLTRELENRSEGDSPYGAVNQVVRSFFLKDFGRWGRYGDERGFQVLSRQNRSLRSRLRFALATALALIAFQVYPLTNEKEGY